MRRGVLGSLIYNPNAFADNLRDSGTFWLFASFCIVGFFTIVWVPETKGKSLEMIEAELMNDMERVGFLETFELVD